MKTIKVSDAAKILNVSIRTLYNHCAEGTFPCLRLGRKILIRTQDVEAFLNGQSVGPPTCHFANTETKEPHVVVGCGDGKDVTPSTSCA